jgi:chitosanase
MVTKSNSKPKTKKQTVTKRPKSKVATTKTPLKSRTAAVKPRRSPQSAKKTSLKPQLQPVHKKLIGAFIALAVIAVGAASLVRSPAIDAASVAGPITGVASKCLDNKDSETANGNKIQLYKCKGTANQAWTVMDDDTIRVQGKCLDVYGARKAERTLVQLYKCNGTVAQKWKINSDKSIVNPNSGLCLDDKYRNTDDGNTIWMWRCNKTSAQIWTTPQIISPEAAIGPTEDEPTPTPSPTPQPTPAPSPSKSTLRDAAKKELAMKLVASAENSSLDWKAQYAYIEDIGDGRGYTAGIIGFCTSLDMCGDLIELVQYYTSLKPNNVLAKYIPALKKTTNDTHKGLDPNFTKDWKTAATDSVFRQAQDRERDRIYFEPAVKLAISDGLPVLGQFAYYDAAVVHGYEGLTSIRARALKKSKTPAQGANVTVYMNAFFDERVVEMKKEAAHEDVSRIEKAQRKFLKEGNLDLNAPLKWSVYGDPFEIK